jgi:hypothetical protein
MTMHMHADPRWMTRAATEELEDSDAQESCETRT